MMHERRFPASQAQRLESPERLVWLPPAKVVEALAVQPGETVADVGAGTGYFSLPLASAVGDEGRLYAVDAQAEMLELLREKLEKSRLSNIDLMLAEADRTGLSASSCDLFFLANLWHEIEDRVAVLSEAQRVLKEGGRIAILDWRTDVEPLAGPPLAHRIAPTDALREMRTAGFERMVSTEIGLYSWLVQGEKVQ